LRFVEREFAAAGQRVFGVSINGVTVIARLDLAGQYGLLQPAILRTRARATAGAGLEIEFTPITGRPVLSAVRVRRVL
jgi:beta-galactosidase